MNFWPSFLGFVSVSSSGNSCQLLQLMNPLNQSQLATRCSAIWKVKLKPSFNYFHLTVMFGKKGAFFKVWTQLILLSTEAQMIKCIFLQRSVCFSIFFYHFIFHIFLSGKLFTLAGGMLQLESSVVPHWRSIKLINNLMLLKSTETARENLTSVGHKTAKPQNRRNK